MRNRHHFRDHRDFHPHHHHPHHRHPFEDHGGDMPRGRKLGSDDLQLIILAFLEEKPAHGYELIKALSERSGGFYTPSPGVIYPALMYLHEAGYAKVEEEGTRKLYVLTPEGKAFLDQNRVAASRILEMMARIGGRMEDVRDAFSGAHEFESDPRDEVHRARHALKDALRSKRGSGPEEALRIAGILNRATAEILSKPNS